MMNLKTFFVFALALILCIASSGTLYSNNTAGPIFMKSGKILPSQATLSTASISKVSSEKVHVLIQFDHLPTNKEKSLLKQHNVVLLEYIPKNAWIASIKGNRLNSIASESSTTFIKTLNVKDKLDPVFNHGIPNYIKNGDGTINLQVLFYRDVSEGSARQYLLNYGKIIEEPKIKKVPWLVSIPESSLQEFANNDIVEWVEPGPPQLAVTNDGARNATSADTVQHAPYNLNGSGIVLAEWDAGHANHTDFNSRTIVGDPGDGSTNAHSTHVAGTMLGNGSNSVVNNGTARQWKGMAPNATLITYEWPNTLDELYNETNASINDYGAVLSQNSWSYDISSTSCDYLGLYNSWSRAYDDLVNGYNTSRAIIVVFAAGNERNKNYNASCNPSAFKYNTSPGPGATAKNTITVGAIYSDTLGMTDFSSWGPTDDGRLKPDIVAPGSEIGGDHGIKSTYPTTTYVVYQGTSMAAPVVSGISALVIKEYNNTHKKFPWPSTVKGILIQTALDLNETGPDYTTGYGLVNATRAIDLVKIDNFSNGSSYIVESAVSNGQARNYTAHVINSSELKVTLVWDDYPGAPEAAKELVNDLDLVVIAPNGSQIYPWTLDPSNPSAPAVRNKKDDTNPVEQVYVSNPMNGNWQIIVNGTSIPYSPENFSLVSNQNLAQEKPTIYIMSQNNTKTTNNTPAILFNFTDPDNLTAQATLYFSNGTSTLNVSYNSSAFNNTPTSLTASALSDGNWTFWVSVSDGIYTNTSLRYSILIDTTPPASVSGLGASAQNLSWIYWTWTNPNGSDFNHTEVYLNGTFKKNVTTNNTFSFYNATGLSLNTLYELETITVDNLGNRNTTGSNSTASTIADTIPPSVSLLAPGNITTKNTTLLFNCSATDNYNLSNLTLYTNLTGNWQKTNSTNVSGTSAWANWTISNISDGLYIWNCLGYDTSNNSAFATTNNTFRIDTTPPETISNLSNQSQGASWIFWNWTNPSTDFNHVEIYLNGTFRENLSSNYFNATNLTLSTLYELGILTVDSAGNVNTTWINNTTRTTLDLTPPSISLLAPGNITTKNTTLLFNCSATDNYNLSNLTLYTNLTGNWQKTNSTNVSGTSAWANWTISNISDGLYIWNCLGYDTSNNSAFATTNNTFRIDTTPPNVTLVSPIDQKTTTSSTILFNCSAEDNINLSNVSFYGNFGGSWALLETRNISGNSSWANFTRSLSDGTYIWNCKAWDLAGNSVFASSNRTIIKTSSVTTSSGGGGGSAAAPLPQESVQIGNVKSGSEIIKEFKNSDKIYVSEVKLKAKNNINNAIVKVIRYLSKPGLVSEPKNPAFAYLSIEPINFNDTSIEDAEIKFKVNKSWVESKGINKDEVILLRYSNESWNTLETKYVYSTSTGYYYEAITPGLSTFAISFEEKPVQVSVENKTFEIKTNKTSTQNNVPNSTKENKNKVSVIPVIIILIVVFLAVFFITLFGLGKFSSKKSI